MRDNRRKEMASFIARRQSVTMSELCSEFHVSINTIRADVAALAKSGIVEKIYGGVRSAMKQDVPVFTQRTRLRPDAKLDISRTAVGMIKNGDTLFIDAGTTTMHMMALLDPEIKVTVITANLQIINQAYSKPNAEIIVLPGILNRRTNSLADVSTLEFLGRYHFSKVFMAATGISTDGKLNVKTYLEYEIKQLAMKQSETHILMCDASKYGSNGLMSYATLTDVDTLVTDDTCPEDLRILCAQTGTELIIAR